MLFRSTVGITAYGGRGDDVLYGSQAGDFLAGGSGDDLIVGGRGIDQIYGDSGINVDVLSRNLAIPTAAGSSLRARDDLTAGKDTLHGDFPGTGFVLGYTPAPAFVDNGTSPATAYKDIVFGDHGVVVQLRVLDPRLVFFIGALRFLDAQIPLHVRGLAPAANPALKHEVALAAFGERQRFGGGERVGWTSLVQ